MSTAVTALIICGSALTILLTSGRSAAAEAAVLSTIDAQGTRTVTVQVKGELAALTREMVDDLAALPEVEDVLGLGPVTDVTAAALPAGQRVGMRAVYGWLAGQPVQQEPGQIGLGAHLSTRASAALGMPSGAGAVRVVDGEEHLVTAELHLPEFLAGLEPAAFVPVAVNDLDAQFSSVVVLVRSPSAVALVARYARSQVTDIPRDQVSVTTSEEMAELRRVVGGQLTAQGRAIVTGVLGAATLATLINVWGLSLMRRRDIGRRRALGATRATIVTLMVAQVAFTALVAASLGTITGMTVLTLGTGPAPALSYAAAVAVVLTLAAALSAGIPALVAARRDPLHELRVP